jgi:hypothetical protein
LTSPATRPVGCRRLIGPDYVRSDINCKRSLTLLEPAVEQARRGRLMMLGCHEACHRDDHPDRIQAEPPGAPPAGYHIAGGSVRDTSPSQSSRLNFLAESRGDRIVSKSNPHVKLHKASPSELLSGICPQSFCHFEGGRPRPQRCGALSQPRTSYLEPESIPDTSEETS